MGPSRPRSLRTTGTSSLRSLRHESGTALTGPPLQIGGGRLRSTRESFRGQSLLYQFCAETAHFTTCRHCSCRRHWRQKRNAGSVEQTARARVRARLARSIVLPRNAGHCIRNSTKLWLGFARHSDRRLTCAPLVCSVWGSFSGAFGRHRLQPKVSIRSLPPICNRKAIFQSAHKFRASGSRILTKYNLNWD